MSAELAEVRAPPRLLCWAAIGGILLSKVLNLSELIRTGDVRSIPKRALVIVTEATREVKEEREKAKAA